MSLKSIAEQYFSTMNPTASRIYTAFEETKTAYADLWNKISEVEQNQLLNESVIKPEVVIKYGPSESRTNEHFASKIIIEDHCSYRDEHSGPFSFRTLSQRDLTIFQNDKKNKVEVMKPKPKPVIYRETKFVDSHLDDILTIETTTTNTLPKTGLDFLDNW